MGHNNSHTSPSTHSTPSTHTHTYLTHRPNIITITTNTTMITMARRVMTIGAVAFDVEGASVEIGGAVFVRKKKACNSSAG